MPARELKILYVEGHVHVCDTETIALTPQRAAAFMCERLACEAVEVFGVLCLTTRGTIIGFHEVSRGSLNVTIVHPREIFKAALLANAAAVILAHNHPSGDPSPSPEDHTITTRLRRAGRLLGIEVLDHVVVGHDGRYYSFYEQGSLVHQEGG